MSRTIDAVLHARTSVLERMGLKPIVSLWLANSHRIGILITELKSVGTSFEVLDAV